MKHSLFTTADTVGSDCPVFDDITQLTREQALAFAENKHWESLSLKARALFQIYQDKLCMPIDVFHEAVEKTLGRPVYTHEFALNLPGLKAELMGLADAPTLHDVSTATNLLLITTNEAHCGVGQ